MKLFKSKSKQMKEVCQDIHVLVDDSVKIIEDSNSIISDTQKDIKSIKEGINKLIKFNEDMSDKLAGGLN